MRVAALLLASLVAFALPACSAGDPEAKFERDLRAAEKQAQATLDLFWQRFEAPLETEYDFLVRAEVAEPDDAERREELWIEVLSYSRDTGAIEGQLASEPDVLVGLARGDRVSLDEKEVVDWAYFSGMQLLGHYTTRVRLPNMPPDQAEALRSLLGENPQ